MLRVAMRLPSPTLPELQRMTRKHAVMVVHVHVRARARRRRLFRTSGRSSERPLPPTEQPTPVRRAKVHTPTLPSLDAQHSGWRVHWVGVMMIVDAWKTGPRAVMRRLLESTRAMRSIDLSIGGVVGGGGCRTRVASVDGHAGYAARTLRRAYFVPVVAVSPGGSHSSFRRNSNGQGNDYNSYSSCRYHFGTYPDIFSTVSRDYRSRLLHM